MPRLTKIEKLARDICWAEWSGVPPRGKTKTEYWNYVSANKKAEYVRDAEWLLFICQKIKPLRIFQFVDYPRQPKRSRR